MAETNGLLNRRTDNSVPRVRIPPSPPFSSVRNSMDGAYGAGLREHLGYAAFRKNAAASNQRPASAMLKIAPRISVERLAPPAAACRTAVTAIARIMRMGLNRAQTTPISATNRTPINIRLYGLSSEPIMPSTVLTLIVRSAVITASAAPQR